MKKRIRIRRKRRTYKFIFFLIFIMAIYYIYKNIDKDTFIKMIINDSKNDTFLISKYNDPEYIISNYLIKRDKKIEIDKKYRVYIYSTHENESYKDNRFQEYNIRPNVKMMDYILKDYLEHYNVYSYVEEDSVTDILNSKHLAYKYSYEASKVLVLNRLDNYPDLELIIDLHRDSSNLDKTLLEVSNKKYARILFVIGGENPNYEINYNIALTLSNLLNNKVNNLSRGIIVKKGDGVNGVYNQDLSKKAVLIELGGQYNEMDELNNSLEKLANVIYEYLGDIDEK